MNNLIDEILESPAFWILAGLGLGAELLGYIVGKNMGFDSFPLWQLLIVMAGTLVAAAFFALKE